jgi:hypothetical protein
MQIPSSSCSALITRAQHNKNKKLTENMILQTQLKSNVPCQPTAISCNAKQNDQQAKDLCDEKEEGLL